jgi:tripartite-type tricarboxylate transporter receptor subunit TctC
VAGSDYIAAQPATGLVFGLLESTNVLALAVTGTPGLNFNPEREAFVGTIPNPACTVVTTKPGSALSSFASILAATPSSPAVEETEPTGGTYINQRLFNIAFGINARIITGYSSSNAILQGFLRGDSDVISNNTSGMVASINGGAAKPVAISLPCPKAASFSSVVRGVPTYAQLFKTYPAKTADQKVARSYLFASTALPTEALVTQTKVPADEVAALRWAIQQAEQNKSCQTQLNASGNPYGWTSGPTAKAAYITLTKIYPKIYKFLGIPTV